MMTYIPYNKQDSKWIQNCSIWFFQVFETKFKLVQSLIKLTHKIIWYGDVHSGFIVVTLALIILCHFLHPLFPLCTAWLPKAEELVKCETYLGYLIIKSTDSFHLWNCLVWKCTFKIHSCHPCINHPLTFTTPFVPTVHCVTAKGGRVGQVWNGAAH